MYLNQNGGCSFILSALDTMLLGLLTFEWEPTFEIHIGALFLYLFQWILRSVWTQHLASSPWSQWHGDPPHPTPAQPVVQGKFLHRWSKWSWHWSWLKSLPVPLSSAVSDQHAEVNILSGTWAHSHKNLFPLKVSVALRQNAREREGRPGKASCAC